MGAALQKIARGTLLLALSLAAQVLRTALIVNGRAINNNLAADGYFPPLRTHGNLCSRLLLSGKLAVVAKEG